MRIRILGCSGGIGAGSRTSALLIDNDVLIDAGTGIGDLELDDLDSIRHVFLTHAHLDHVAGGGVVHDPQVAGIRVLGDAVGRGQRGRRRKSLPVGGFGGLGHGRRFQRGQDRRRRDPATVLLAIDTSGSMSETECSEGMRKIEVARTALASFADSVPGPASAYAGSLMSQGDAAVRTYRVRTYGCQMNVHDSERIGGLLESAGYSRAAEGDQADVVVLNTCAVRENADNRLYGNLGHLASAKRRRLQRAMLRLEEKLAARLKKRRPRIKTRPGKAAITRRLDAKRRQGEKKAIRKKVEERD